MFPSCSRTGTLAPLVALLLAIACGVSAHAAPPDLPHAERLIVERSNTFRADDGAAPLKVESRLAAAARQFADFMARTGDYGHEADGHTPFQRAQAQGYAWCLVAENIAMQYSSAGFETEDLAERFMRGWIESPDHRRNLLNPAVTEIGVAVSHGQNDRYYAVQVFGRPASQILRFEIENRSTRAVQYRLGPTTYVLPTGGTRRHEACTVAPIELIVPARPDPVRVQPRDGGQYRIEGAGPTIRLVGEAAPRG